MTVASAPPSLSSRGQYEWHQSSDGLWHRNIDEAERFYASFCRSPDDPDSASFPVTCHASFIAVEHTHGNTETVDQIVEDAFRKAWVALRRQHPAIVSWIEFNSEKGDWEKVCDLLHQSGDYAASQTEWLSNSFKTAILGANDLFNNNSPMPKLPTLYLVRASPLDENSWSGAVYLRFPHDIIDGIGILNLLNRLFELARASYHGHELDQQLSGDECSRLSVPLSVATRIPHNPTDRQKTLFQDMLAHNATIQSEKPLLGLRLSAPGNTGCTQRATVSLSKDASARLLEICRHHGITVTHAVSAAVVMALRDLDESNPEISSVRYSNQALFNLRNYCDSSIDPLTVANYHMIAPCTMAIDLVSSSRHESSQKNCAEELLSVAKQFKAYYSTVRAGLNGRDRDFLSFAPMTWELFTPKQSSASPPQSRNAAVAISSLGNLSAIIKPTYGPFSITDAWVSGEPLGTGVSIFLYTLSGITSISMLFNSQFHEKEYIQTFQKKIIDCLIVGAQLG